MAIPSSAMSFLNKIVAYDWNWLYCSVQSTHIPLSNMKLCKWIINEDIFLSSFASSIVKLMVQVHIFSQMLTNFHGNKIAINTTHVIPSSCPFFGNVLHIEIRNIVIKQLRTGLTQNLKQLHMTHLHLTSQHNHQIMTQILKLL